MRILFVIPHFYRESGTGIHGSGLSVREHRRQVLVDTLTTLHATFGFRHGMMHGPSQRVLEANSSVSHEIEVVVCTTGPHHLLADVPAGLCRHFPTTAQSLQLGYEGHGVLRDGLGRYDYYCYLEDDVRVMDSLFFDKLRWFTSIAGDDAVLQPNRFEQAAGQPVNKLYIDGDIVDTSISRRYQDVDDRPRITGDCLGTSFVFERPNNPHAGCFFLDEVQMRQWTEKPYFLDRSDRFWGPLESASTLGIMRTFRLYKPARANAGFLEVAHGDNTYLGSRLTLRDDLSFTL